MVDRRRIEELKEQLAETLREIEALEQEAAEELATPQERRARFRLIRGGKVVVLAPFAWLAARARDHHAAAAVAGSTVIAVGAAVGTGLLVSADGIERQTDSQPRPIDTFVATPLVAPTGQGTPKPQPASTETLPVREAASQNAESSNTPLPNPSPSSTALGIDVPYLPLLPPVSVPAQIPPLPTVLPSPEPTRSQAESEALQHCLALIPPPIDIDACVRDILD
ncbi:MAG TPA: hypothetical protein VIQ02_14185 [Jiangellaceae bacterium]